MRDPKALSSVAGHACKVLTLPLDRTTRKTRVVETDHSLAQQPTPKIMHPSPVQLQCIRRPRGMHTSLLAKTTKRTSCSQRVDQNTSYFTKLHAQRVRRHAFRLYPSPIKAGDTIINMYGSLKKCSQSQRTRRGISEPTKVRRYMSLYSATYAELKGEGSERLHMIASDSSRWKPRHESLWPLCY